LLSEVEQICDRVIIISRGRVVKSGRMQEWLAVVDRVELLASGMTRDLEQKIVESGGSVAAGENGVIRTVHVAQKRETVEALWAAGFEVIHMMPVRQSLEQSYMKTVGSEGGLA
jgi:ABC-2 type transport system ATP-binding protein